MTRRNNWRIRAQQLRSQLGAVLLAALAGLVLLTSSCSRGTPEPPPKPVVQTPQPEDPPPAEPAVDPAPKVVIKPLSLSPFAPVTLQPGASAEVVLQVDRAGNEGEINVEVGGIPEGVTVEKSPLAAGESQGKLKISADIKLGDEDLLRDMQVTVSIGTIAATQPLTLAVNEVKLPSFAPPTDLILAPGGSTTVQLALERNGYEGPLPLKITGAPAKVTVTAEPVADDGNATDLVVTAAADAPNVKTSFSITAEHLGRTISIDVPLQVDNRPYSVDSFQVATIKPGETQDIEINIGRRTYQGPITLELKELPPGVTAAKVDVPMAATTATIQLAAAPDAKERVRSVQVASTAGTLTRTDPLVVRVSHGEGGFLPREITADPELSPLLRRGSFGGRLTARSKNALLDAYGGTQESEEAVMKGLLWLAAHQQEDGRWYLKNYSENLRGCDCCKKFEDEVVDNDTAGTAFGLLPLLGAGITHNRAPEQPPELARYQKVVERGLNYLMRIQDKSRDPKKSGFLGGNSYSHVIATMALCEAYGLSGDERLKVPAQLAVKYITNSQHPEGGGWRYSYQQAGDMSATAWMFLGIRTGQLAGMSIEKSPLTRAERFIDSCAAGPSDAKFSRYAYTPDQQSKLSLSAAGLLTREYLGWKRDNPDLVAGSQYLMENLPPESSDKLGPIYYYYYATQALHHLEGPDFDLWNHRMREHLIRTQEKEYHQTGSWNPEGSDWGARGGRLYATSLALMTLQVYYRHLPMYRPVLRGSDTQNLTLGEQDR
ncbi:MAG: terpene cyclase/mutase family protein [Pirellulaceae bacterium]